MPKLVLSDIGYIPSSAGTINANNQRIEEAIENTLSRDGTAPNEMNTDLDMNDNRITNLPAATTANEPVRKAEFDTLIGTVSAFANAADASAVLADTRADAAAVSESNALASANAADVSEAAALASANAADASADDAAASAADAATSVTGAVKYNEVQTLTAPESLQARTNIAISAANVPFTPTGSIAATDVQAAIAEVSGDVSGLVDGPVSSVDNGVVRWDGTTGNLVQDSSITLSDTGVLSRTGGIEIQGKNTNAAPAAGYFGELISSDIDSGGAVTLTTGVAANITSIVLTAGSWLISGMVQFNVGTGATRIEASINNTSATIPNTVGYLYNVLSATFVAGDPDALSVSPRLVRLNSTTTYYIIARCIYASGTSNAYGSIQAVRLA